MRNRFIIALLVLVLLVPVVFGAISFTDSIVSVGTTLHRLLSDTYVVYAATFILFFIFLYSIFAAGLSRVPVFRQDNGINRQGKMVAVSLGLISSIGTFYFMRGMEESIKRVAGSMGFFAGIAFAGTIFGITYFNMKTTEPGTMQGGPAFFAAAMALIVYGMFADNQTATSWGTLILLVAAIWAGIRAIGSVNGRRPGERREERERRREEDDAERRRRAGVPVPQQVTITNGVMTGPPNNAVNLTWSASPAGDNVVACQIQRRLAGRSVGNWARRALTAIRRDMATGWRNITNNAAGTTYADGPLNTAVDYEYRIRPRNNQGTNGPWSNYYRVNSVLAPPVNPTTITGEVIFHDGTAARPIENINVTVQGLPACATVTDVNGLFRIPNIPSAAPFNVLLNDPTETYNQRILPNVPTGGAVNFPNIVLLPSGTQAALTVRIIDRFLAAPVPPPIVIAVLGGPGGLVTLNIPAGTPAPGGIFTLNNQPAGYFYRVIAFHLPTGTVSETDLENGVLLRRMTSQIPGIVYMSVPVGSNVTGQVRSSVPPNALITTATVNIGGRPGRSAPTGIYNCAGVAAGQQRVQAADEMKMYQNFDSNPNPGVLVTPPGPTNLPIYMNPVVPVPHTVTAIITPGTGAPAYTMVF